MCGIWLYFRSNQSESEYSSNQQLEDETLQYLREHFVKINHRGPDCNSFHHLTPNLIFGFHRLAIMDTSCLADQPLIGEKSVVICNGEIFNYRTLINELDYHPRTGSDCEIILPLYEKHGILATVQQLDAEFAFVIYDKTCNQLHIARDRFGVRPLFWAITPDGQLFLSSEAKAIPTLDSKGMLVKVQPFPPGHYLTISMDPVKNIDSTKEMKFPGPASLVNSVDLEPKPFFQFHNAISPSLNNEEKIHENIAELVTSAVKKRLMSDRPLGCFLSGGLDSSLVTSITWHQFSPTERKNFHCFSIGLPNSVDIKAAEEVVKYLGIQHHHIVNFSIEEGLEALEQVIYHLESYDVTTIRASVPQYLLAKYIAGKTSIRVLLSGEGADELFGGYQYFKKCPDAESLRKESRRLLSELYLFDNLRTDRTTAAHGLEVRAPFLDRDLVDYVDQISAEYRMCSDCKMEKKVLRDSFNEKEMLPDSILYRRKEAFSDAVSSQETSWYQSLVKHIEKKMLKDVTENELLERGKTCYPFNSPRTLEGLYYRELFEHHHSGRANLIPHYWMPRWVQLKKWDPSATQLDCHECS